VKRTQIFIKVFLKLVYSVPTFLEHPVRTKQTQIKMNPGDAAAGGEATLVVHGNADEIVA
jgi:hypothetical protein